MPRRTIPKPSVKQAARQPTRLTVLELEQYLIRVGTPLSREMIYNHIRRAGLKTDAAHKVDLQEFLAAYAGAKERDNKHLPSADTPPSKDPRLYKIGLECMILKIKLDQLKGELVPMADHQAAIREMAGWVRDTFAQFIADVKVLTADARVVADAQRLRNNLFARIREKAGEEAHT